MEKLDGLTQTFKQLANNRPLNLGARILVLGGIVWWIANRFNLTEAVMILSAPDPAALFGMVVCGLLFAVVGGVKIWTLLRTIAQVSLTRTIMYFMVASSIGSFTPASLGDFTMAAFLKRERVPVHDGLAVVLVDRLISVSIYVLVFTPLTLMLLAPNVALWWLPFAYLVAGGVVLGLNASERARRFIRVQLVANYFPFALGFLTTTSRLARQNPLALVSNVAVGLVRCTVGGVVVWFALAAVGTNAALWQVVVLTNTLAVINLIPISFGGLGVYEGGGVLLFEAMGMSGPHVLAALVLQRIYVAVSSLLIMGIAAAVVWWGRHHPAIEKEVQRV